MNPQLLAILGKLRGAEVVEDGAAVNLGALHAHLHAQAERVGTVLGQPDGTSGIDPASVRTFLAWVTADDANAVQLQRQLYLFNGSGVPGRVAGDALEGLLPPHSALGVDRAGNRVDPATFNFNRVAPELSPHAMLFAVNVRGHAVLDHAEEVLTRARADVTFNRFFIASRNRTEEYLNLINFLLPRDAAQATALTDEDVYLIWESLARVDAERGNHDIVINNRLQNVQRLAEAFLRATGLQPMSQPALAQTDQRLVIGGMAAGVGAVWSDEVPGLIEGKPDVSALYHALRPAFVQEGVEDPEVLRQLDPNIADTPETHATWLRVNGVVHNMPATDLVQILRMRDLQSYGIDNAAFGATAGQSAGQIRALGMARAFRLTDEESLLPRGAGGFQTVEELDHELRFDLRESFWYQYYLPEGKRLGELVAMNISGIPYARREDFEDSPLGQMIAIINRHCGANDHIVASNLTAPAPYYFGLIAGTTNALMALRLMIYNFRRRAGVLEKDTDQPDGLAAPPRTSPEAVRIAHAATGEVIPIFAGIRNPRGVGAPMDSQELGLTIPPHDPFVLGPARDSFVAEMEGRGLLIGEPVTTVISHTYGESITALAARQGRSLTRVHADDNYMNQVWLREIARGLGDAGVHLVVGSGPTTVSEGFLRKSDVGVPVLALAKDDDWTVATTRDPRVLEAALGVADTSTVYLPGGGSVRVDAKGEVKMTATRAAAAVSGGSTGFEGIPNVSVNREDLGDGNTRVRVDVRGNVAETDVARFQTALTQGTGRIPFLLETEHLYYPNEVSTEGHGNPFAQLTVPRAGWSYEWIEGRGTNSAVWEFRIYEGGRLALELTREEPLGLGIQAREFLDTPHGRSVLDRHYIITNLPAESRSGSYEGATILDLNTGPEWRARAREAYRTDWGVGSIPGVRELLATPATPDFLQNLRLTTTYQTSTEDMAAYARTMGLASAYPVGYLKDRVMGRLNLVTFLADALDLDPTRILNMGGAELIEEDDLGHPLFQPGQNVTVNAYITNVEDIHDGPRQGRQVRVYVEARNEGGQLLARGLPTILELRPNDVANGEIRDVFAPRVDLDTTVDPLAKKRVYTLKRPRVVARGFVTVPPGVPAAFVDDAQRRHTSEVSSLLASDGQMGAIAQGEVSYNLGIDAILQAPLTTAGRTERYRGFRERTFDQPVTPGETLAYETRRIRHGQGLHEYETVFTNASGDEVMRFTHYDRARRRVFLWGGQGSLEPGMGAMVRSDPARAAIVDELQRHVSDTGYGVNLTAALDAGTKDTALAQPAQAAFVIPYWRQAVDAGLIPDDAEHAGLSLGSWLAMYGAGYLGEATLLPGLARRGDEMGALVDETSGMGEVKKFKGTRAQADALCKEASQPGENVAVSNYNASRYFTVSGDLVAIDRLLALILTRKLAVNAERYGAVKTPFHHEKLRPASDRMRPMMKEQGVFAHPVRTPQPAFMDTTLRYHDPLNPDQIADDFADQISNPTNFAGVTTHFVTRGDREFVEVNASPTLTYLVGSQAGSLGLGHDDLRLMQVSPDVDPEAYGFFTYDAEGLDAEVVEVPKEEEAGASAPPPTPPPTPQPIAEVRGPVTMPVWGEMSAAEFRQAQVGIASALISRMVDPTNVATAGAQPLFGVVTTGSNDIDVKEAAPYRALTTAVVAEYKTALRDPGAIAALTAHVHYLRGILAEGEAPTVSATWADATDEEILQVIGAVWGANKEVGQFKYNPDNLALDAEFADKGSKPIGISSKKATNALRMLSVVFGVNFTKAESEKFANLGLIVAAIKQKLTAKVDPIPSGKSVVRHLLTLELKAEEMALALLEADQQKAVKAAQATTAGGGSGMSAAQMDEMRGEIRDEFTAALEAREDAFQRAAREGLLATARAHGINLNPADMARVTITRDGQMVPVDRVQAQRDARTVAEVKEMVSPEVVAAAHPSYDPAREYSFADVAKNGTDGQILRFVADLRWGRLADPDTLRERIAVLANQMDAIRLEHLRGRRNMLTDTAELAVMDRLIAASAKVVAEGPQFAGVIGVHSAYHRPIYGTSGTELVDRGRTFNQNLEAYSEVGIPEASINNLQGLVRDGADLRGMDFVVSAATGSIGAGIVVDLMRLGGRVIVLDYRGRSAPDREGGFRNDFYRTLRNEDSIAGLPHDQLVIEPYFTQGNDEDRKKLVAHFWDRGYRIRGFFHTAAVSDYGPIEDKGRPYDMDRVHVTFPLELEKDLAVWYRDHEDDLKREFFEQHKAEFREVAVAELPGHLQAKYASGPTVLAMPSGTVEGITELLPLDEAFWYIFVSERVPTPNERNQLVGSGNYGRKAGAAPGASSENLYNSGITWRNGDPIEIEDEHRTGAVYPPEGLSPDSLPEGEEAKTHLMENAARSQLGFEGVARDEYGVPFYGMQPSEAAAFIVADKIDLLTQGPRAYRHAARVLVPGEAPRRPNPTVTREHNLTAGFTPLARASKVRGEVVGTFAEKVGAREKARHEMAARFVVPAATDAVHLPLDGSTNDPNYAVFEQTVIDGETDGAFAARPTDIYPRPHTMMTIGHAVLGTGGASTVGSTRYRLSRGDVIGLPAHLKWITTPDLWDQAKGIGLNVDGMSLEQIQATHGREIAKKTGAQRLPEAMKFEYEVQVDIGKVQFELPASDLERAQAFEAAGATLRYPTFDGKIEVTFPEGTKVGVKAIAQLPTDIVVDLPGGGDFKFEAYGANNETDKSENANAKRMGTVVEGGAYATAGETPASLNEKFGRKRRHAIKTLAGPEAKPVVQMTLNPKQNKPVTGDAMAAHLLEHWGGGSSIEPTGTNYTGGRWCVPGACSSGNLADTLAGELVRSAYFMVEHDGMSPSIIPAVVDIGNADDFATYYGFIAFIAAGALMTYDRAAELDLPAARWSRPNDINVGGFVPGRGAADILEQPAEFTEGRMWRTGVIGTGGNPPDGLDEGPREAYGQGLILSIFRTWAQARNYIPGATDREKMDNIELIIQGHMTSTPLGDGFENLVKNLFLRWAGVESFEPFYTPGHRLYLGYTDFEEMVGDLVGAKGPDGIKALGAYLEAHVPDELKNAFGRDPADPAYSGESKADDGHKLGAASASDKAEVQTLAAFEVLPGNVAFDNLRPEAANDPYLLHVNDAVYLPAVTARKRPKVFLSLAAGFSRNNTSRAEAEMRRRYPNRPAAIITRAADIRQWALERAQLRGIRENTRPQVAGATAMPYPYTEYQDLRFLHGKSVAITEYMFRTGQHLDFDHIMDWAVNPELAWDSGAVVRRADRRIEDGFRRIQAAEVIASQKPQFVATMARAAELNIGEQPHKYLGGSEGQALQALVYDILTSKPKHAVVIHKDNEGTPPYYNAQALKAWAATHGITLEVVNANAVIFDSSSVVFNNGITPETADWNNLTTEDIAWDKLKYNAYDPSVLRAIGKVWDRTGRKPNWVIKNFIAWGAPERAPGAGKIQVPSIDPDGRLFMATIEDVETWDDAIQRTIGSMGFNHWAIIQHASDMGLIDEEAALQVVAYPFFFSGASRKIGDGAAVLFGLLQKAILDLTGEWLSISDLAAQASLELLQSQIKVGKGIVVQADWQNGLNPKAMPGVYYGTKESGLASLGIAKLIAVLAAKYLRDKFGTEQPILKVEVDQHEARVIDAIYEVMKDLDTRITEWIAANPTLVQTDSNGRQYIPTEATLALLGQNLPSDALEILSQYQATDVRKTRALATGPSPIHNGEPSINSNFAVAEVTGEVEFASESTTTVATHVPENYAGYSGVAHGGRIDGLFDAAMLKAQAAHPMEDFDIARMPRSVEYLANVPAGSDVTIVIDRWPHSGTEVRTIVMRMLAADGTTELARAAYSAARTWPMRNGEIHVSVIDTDATAVKDFATPVTSDLKPHQLEVDREFGCLPHCVAAGHASDTGLHFKYAFDAENKALWGVFDSTGDPQTDVQGLMLAADDMAAWTGLRASQMWGFTTNNYYVPLRAIQPGERLFLVSRIPQVGEATDFDVPIRIMNAEGEIVGLFQGEFFPDERATINGLRGAIQALERAKAGDTRAMATVQFLRESMGSKFKEMEMKAQFQLAQEARRARLGQSVPAAPAGAEIHDLAHERGAYAGEQAARVQDARGTPGLGVTTGPAGTVLNEADRRARLARPTGTDGGSTPATGSTKQWHPGLETNSPEALARQAEADQVMQQNTEPVNGTAALATEPALMTSDERLILSDQRPATSFRQYASLPKGATLRWATSLDQPAANDPAVLTSATSSSRPVIHHDFRSTAVRSHSTHHSSRSAIHDPRSTIRDPRTAIHHQASADAALWAGGGFSVGAVTTTSTSFLATVGI